MKKYIIISMILIASSCNKDAKTKMFSKENRADFLPGSYELIDNNVKLVRGQILYMPVYSHMPQYNDSSNLSMSAFVAIHNTDFFNSITIKKVQYFDTKGKLVHDFLSDEVKVLTPLEMIDYYIPYSDQSGIGANFLIEWVSDSLVTEPLIESVSINLMGYYTVGLLSQGKIIKER